MENIYSITDTYELIQLVERIKPPAKYLVETFFPNSMTTLRDVIPLEYTKEHRRVAPFISGGAKAGEVARQGSQVRMYKVPLMGVRRSISAEDISQRIIGEQPIYSTMTPEDRAAELQARDMVELMRMVKNAESAMAAELLQTGKITVSGYADDGRLLDAQIIDFGFSGAVTKDWTASNATIYDDIKDASDRIQEASGIIPTLMICGSNVEKYLLNNKAFKEFLFSANANAAFWVNFKPQYSSPQVRHLGFIPALNLEIVSYNETYLTRDGEVKPFIAPNSVIIGIPQRGKMMYGAVSYLEQGGNWKTAASPAVPVYHYDTNSQTTSLSIYSRALPVPEDIGDWVTLTVAS